MSSADVLSRERVAAISERHCLTPKGFERVKKMTEAASELAALAELIRTAPGRSRELEQALGLLDSALMKAVAGVSRG